MAMAAPWSPPPSRCPAATASTSAPRLLAPTPSPSRRLRRAASSPAAAGSTRSFRQPGTSRRRGHLSVRATAAAPPPPPVDFADSGSSSGADADYIASLKVKLLSAVAGLNRGLAASSEDLSRADAAARALESAGGGVDLSRDLDKLQGRWRLVYSSAFSSGTLGGSRPGPPTGRLLPVTLGQVFQRIDVVSSDLDNVVELELGAPWPLPPVEAVATLAHRMEVVGAAGVRIVFERTTVKTKGTSLLAQLPPLEVPRIPESLRPPSSSTGSGEFEVTYLDGDTRVTRGDRGELRVFVIA